MNGITKDELGTLIRELWNQAAEQIAYMRPLKPGGYFDLIWEKLRFFPLSIVREAMKAEIARPTGRPDIRQLPNQCSTSMPRTEYAFAGGRYDRSNVHPYDMTGDRTAFAKHVCDCEVRATFMPEWYDDAIGYIQAGVFDPYPTQTVGNDGRPIMLDYSQLAKKYAARREIIRERIRKAAT
ncbi:MAG: hypothetical protein IMZ62_17345 [Chloroflexi bacterium]|nr:hypothetical protein [Chloroflexota bacterium]